MMTTVKKIKKPSEPLATTLFRVCPVCGQTWFECEMEDWYNETKIVGQQVRSVDDGNKSHRIRATLRQHKCGGKMWDEGVLIRLKTFQGAA